jgi:hypothetical protein
MKKYILFILLILNWGYSNAQRVTITDLSNSVGSWEGKLTYLDYSTAQSITMLANIQISLTADNKGYIMSYEYPKEPQANAKDTTYITKDLFGTDKIVEFTKDTSSGFKMVTEKEGVDGNDNKKAILRHTYTLKSNNYSIIKDVKFDGTDVWIKRNEYQFVKAEDNISISFTNDNKEVYHLSLIIYTPDGKIQTRVSDITPGQIKSYTLPINTEIFIADLKQEAFAMKGNDIKSTKAKPYILIKASDDKSVIKLSSIELNKKTLL